ncbi:rhamnogalacturonan lyase B N-terminal domain-containing protein [Massilia terrae]|uniref:rhamnogalacturonan endolyase n=1 Tax=Massilia terrae TaxID=1811224 RepID=A0ABT2CXD5_9BURK|nr:rhamnogalacturonan lyase B N-terminal domain-containing protein [Massilia terrae]MCS0658622.1 polysaccharide lyase family protein [Massilia terrae]
MATSTATSCTTPAFGVTAASGYLTVSSGAGLVFKVNQSSGDITSITYNCGPELQAQDKFSQISSGLGAAASYSVNGTVAKITIPTSTLTHYMLVRQNDNAIYMGTYISAEPTVGELRWVTRLAKSVFTGVPAESNLTGNTGAIESTDIYGMADGTTRSKYYGNQAAKDLAIRGVTGSGIGVFMAYGNRESSSGGPFFHDIQNQTGFPETNNPGGDVHVYNYMNSGHNQTEAFRTGFHGPYALVFNDGSTTPAVPDMSWMSTQGLQGWVDATGRGGASGAGLTGMDASYSYTVGFANSAAQYWATATSSGAFSLSDMKAGTYTMTVYKGQLAVYTEQVTVTAGSTTSLPSRAINNDPSATTALWRIGDWDGTPLEFMNGTSINVMHPSDVRNAAWGPVSYSVGSAFTTFPAAQWKTGVNNPTTVTFNLTAAQIAAHTIRIGITAAYASGRPQIQVNSWSSSNPAASTQPSSRSLTIGTYRGNNTTFTFPVPSTAFVVGTNTLTINAISGSSGTAFLSPGFSYDALDML